MGEMANADICGACHSRYSYTTDTIAVELTPDDPPTLLLQPQMAIGYPMLGAPAPSPATGWAPASPLSDYLDHAHVWRDADAEPGSHDSRRSHDLLAASGGRRHFRACRHGVAVKGS